MLIRCLYPSRNLCYRSSKLSLFPINFYSINMSWKYQYDGPPRKINRKTKTFNNIDGDWDVGYNFGGNNVSGISGNCSATNTVGFSGGNGGFSGGNSGFTGVTGGNLGFNNNNTSGNGFSDGFYNNNNNFNRNNPNFIGNFNPNCFGAPPPPPPPPPPLVQLPTKISANCGDLRESDHGKFVELEGRVNRARLGRFIELKDQFGVVQLVASNSSPGIVNRFANIPLDSFITVVGHVKKRPDKLQNESLPTGRIEVHVEDILRVYMSKGRQSSDNLMANKRRYSTMAASSTNKIESNLAITSSEYKKSGNSNNILQYFLNRTNTCDSLRMSDVNKTVTLVGWIDFSKQKFPAKFIQLFDGYGQTQLIMDKKDVRDNIDKVTDNDILLVEGRVVARPMSQQFMTINTGEIELYINSIKILNPNDEYTGPIRSTTTSTNSPLSNTENDIPSTKSSTESANNLEIKLNTPKYNQFTCRTHNCGELSNINIGEKITICGWLQFQRMKKFFTLRDGYGETQCLIPEELANQINIDQIPYESIIKVNGIVLARPPQMRNPKMKTGDIEVTLESLEILNPSKSNLPMEVRDFNRAKEAIRLQHRYIDLRFADMQRNLRFRSNFIMKIREYLINSVGFVEVETPTLFRRTPGGAQEFIVPTRKAGHFYSLVQSPQQFKQMLMSGAIDRYFQIARCYRDETTRPDRQPEFTQLDIELSYTNRQNLQNLIENLLVYCWPKEKIQIQIPFPRITYNEALTRYGCDKPDTRFDLLLNDCTEILKSVNTKSCENFAAYGISFKIDDKQTYPSSLKTHINDVLKNDGYKLKFFNVKLTKPKMEWAKKCRIYGVTELMAIDLIKQFNLDQNHTILLATGNKNDVLNLMGKIRLATQQCLEENKLVPIRTNNSFNFLWVVDFPMFIKSETIPHKLESCHHPFTAPHENDLIHLKDSTKHTSIKSQSFDLVLNGMEVGGGSIRIHNGEQQRYVLKEILKFDHSHMNHLIDALESGCPPHGGIALGMDRLISILCDTKSMKDVIAFPKSIDGKDLLSKAPVPVSDEELQIYKINIIDNNNTTTNDNTTNTVTIKNDS